MNSDNSNNNNENNHKLYNLVFNNKYIREIILNHLNKFNILYNNIEFESCNELQHFKYKEYLNDVTFDYNKFSLPENIKNVHCKFYHERLSDSINEERIVPAVELNKLESIEVSIYLHGIDEELLDSFLSKVSSEALLKFKSLNVYSRNELSIKSIPQSISKLYLQKIDQLKKNFLTNNVKELQIKNIKSYEDGCFPESLISANLNGDPLIINQFSFNGLVELEFTCYIHIGDNIRFPNTLQKLSLYCKTFNSSLPDSLKSLTLLLNIYEYEVIFPSSLEHLKVEYRHVSNHSTQNKFSFQNNNNLKSFELSLECSSIVDNNGKSILPDKLTKLLLYGSFNEELKANQLPSTLTYLNLGQSFDQIIDVNVLPTGLKTLILDTEYTQTINPLAIPQQLELLITDNYEILTPIMLTNSHPNLVIKCHNINLYYDPSNTSIRKLQLPDYFNSPLSTLQLQDKSSLEYLHLGLAFDQPIQLVDLPTNNNIKTLVLDSFYQTINLEQFPNLETIFLPPNYTVHSKSPFIKTTINQQDGSYNYYNLKKIIISQDQDNNYNNSQIFNSIDINFYQFIKLNK